MKLDLSSSSKETLIECMYNHTPVIDSEDAIEMIEEYIDDMMCDDDCDCCEEKEDTQTIYSPTVVYGDSLQEVIDQRASDSCQWKTIRTNCIGCPKSGGCCTKN